MKITLKEEIGRIKEIMGVSLLTEAALGGVLDDIFGFLKNADTTGYSSRLSVDQLRAFIERNIRTLRSLGPQISTYQAFHNALERWRFNVGDPVDLMISIYNKTISPEDLRKFIGYLLEETFETGWNQKITKNYIKDIIGEDLYKLYTDVDIKQGYMDGTVPPDMVDDLYNTFKNDVMSNFDENSPLGKEVEKMYEDLTGRSLKDNSPLPKNNMPSPDAPDEVIDEASEDLVKTAEEQVDDIVKAERLDVSDAAKQKKKTEIYEGLENKPQNKWTALDFAWVAWLNKNGLLSADENAKLAAKLPTIKELADLMTAYKNFAAQNKGTTFRTFNQYLKSKGFKIPSFWRTNGAKLYNWFQKVTEPYQKFITFDLSKEWWISAGKIVAHFTVIVSGLFTSVWLFGKRVSEKIAGYLDTLAGLEEPEIQSALDEFFKYDDPKIDGKNIYTSDAEGEFNAGYKQSPPQLDKIINKDNKSISLLTYVIVDKKYCRGFIFDVSQTPLSGSEDFNPHKMTTIPSLCVDTPDPKYMPGGGGGTTPTPPPPAPTKTTLDLFKEFIVAEFGNDPPKNPIYTEITPDAMYNIKDDLGNYNYSYDPATKKFKFVP